MSLPIIIENIETFDDPEHWMGYNITMSDTTKNITCKIENAHICCEKWGIHTETKLNDFIGAEYYSIVTKIKKKNDDELVTLVVTISTNRGNIILHLYNDHNGYYSHDVFIECEKGIKLIKI
jgi:hypothetical protein